MPADKYAIFDEAVRAYREGPGRTFWSDRHRIDALLALERFIAIAASTGKAAQSGSVASAVDIWIAEELRAAGFPEDYTWPRAGAPRVIDPAVLEFIDKLPGRIRGEVAAMVDRRAGSTNVFVMGDAFPKQVDVGVAAPWPNGPEILISTKTMSGSFGKNIANRFEESYGDARNLRSRYPKAAIGFFYLVHADILEEQASFAKLTASLEKLQAGSEIYDAVALIVADWSEEGASLYQMGPKTLDPARFFDRIIDKALLNSAPTAYAEMKERRFRI